MGIDDVELIKVNNAYTEWAAVMRSKPFESADAGVLLDRLRMLMINIGISCARNREVAEKIQSYMSERLRRTALKLISYVSGLQKDKRVIVLQYFFSRVRFTRDIDPESEVEKAAFAVLGRRVERSEMEELMGECTEILKSLYQQLLSPDPWANS